MVDGDKSLSAEKEVFGRRGGSKIAVARTHEKFSIPPSTARRSGYSVRFATVAERRGGGRPLLLFFSSFLLCVCLEWVIRGERRRGSLGLAVEEKERGCQRAKMNI